MSLREIKEDRLQISLTGTTLLPYRTIIIAFDEGERPSQKIEVPLSIGAHTTEL